MKSFKVVETLKVTFDKENGAVITTKTAYFNSKTQTVINNNDVNLDLSNSIQEILNKIQCWISKGSV